MLNLEVVEILTGEARSSLYVLQPDGRVHCTEVLSAGAGQHRIQAMPQLHFLLTVTVGQSLPQREKHLRP